MALLPRRDTPAQDREARRAQQSRTSALSMASGRDTPAQDQNMQRQQTRPQGRAVGRDRIDREQTRANEVGRQQRANPPQGTLRRGALDAVDSMGRTAPTGGANYRDVASRSRADSTPNISSRSTQSGEGNRFLSALSSAGATIADQFRGDPGVGSGFTQQQMAESEAGFTPNLNVRSPGQYFREEGAPSPTVPDWVFGGPSTLMGGGSGQNGGSQTAGAQPTRPQLTEGAIAGATQAGGSATNMGYWAREGGPKNYIPGTQRSQGGISVIGGGGAAADEFARANAIRQEYINSQRPQNQVTIMPNTSGTGGGQSGGGGVDRQIQRLMRDYSSTRDLWGKAAIRSQIEQLQTMADRNVTQQEGAADRQNTLQAQQLRNQGAMATTLAGQQEGSVNPYDQARAMQTMQEIQQGQRADFPTYDPDELEAINAIPDAGMRQVALQRLAQRQDRQFAEASLDNWLSTRGETRGDAIESWQAGEVPEGSELDILLSSVYGGLQPTNEQEENMAGGGLVPEFSAIGFAQGGMVPDQYAAQMGPGMDQGSAVGMGAPGHQGVDLLQQEYTQYAQGAEQLGVPAIPFEEFIGLKQQAIPKAPQAPGPQRPMTGAMQSAIGMAAGGQVPGMDRSDVSGKMIVDSDPEAPQDSIPAVIDGQRPAKLDSGEFVLPRDVVMFFGTDKLNKMIEQAQQKGQGNGSQPGHTSATQQSASAARQ